MRAHVHVRVHAHTHTKPQEGQIIKLNVKVKKK